MTNCKHHPDYTNELPRLNKISGQINGIKKMIEDRRYCPDIIMQLQAISSACKSVEAILLEKHLESCVLGAFNADNKASIAHFSIAFGLRYLLLGLTKSR